VLVAQVTVSPVIVLDGVTAIVAVADLVVSCVLVAFTVTEVPVVGAVNTPAALMVPAEVDQVTAEE
jgi:hypothetical protein